jgi:uncharacterized protein YbbK (DUF523 family)
MKKVLVSACLLGLNTRYDGANNYRENIAKLMDRDDVIIVPFCPEQLGGLTTPREPTDLTGDGGDVIKGIARAITHGGEDVTEHLVRGAKESLKLAKLYRADLIILKARSPSCGVKGIYEYGTRKLMAWDGVTTALLRLSGYRVINDEDFDASALE